MGRRASAAVHPCIQLTPLLATTLVLAQAGAVKELAKHKDDLGHGQVW